MIYPPVSDLLTHCISYSSKAYKTLYTQNINAGYNMQHVCSTWTPWRIPSEIPLRIPYAYYGHNHQHT